HLSAELVDQLPLVEALHGDEQGEFSFGILNQTPLLRDRAVTSDICLPLVKLKGNRSAIAYLVTEVIALLPACSGRVRPVSTGIMCLWGYWKTTVLFPYSRMRFSTCQRT